MSHVKINESDVLIICKTGSLVLHKWLPETQAASQVKLSKKSKYRWCYATTADREIIEGATETPTEASASAG